MDANSEPNESHLLSSTSVDSPPMPLDSRALAAAAERRMQQQREQSVDHPTDFDENHEKRQEFRRMIDPGILRPNPVPIALEALQTLLTLAENIIKHPDDPKYQKFKPTNGKIRKLLVEPKGTLEYAVALGFNPHVEDLQPLYVFNKRRMNDLHIGAAMLREALQRESARVEREALNKQQEKAVAEAAKANIKQAFLDDRKSRLAQEQRERERRAAIASRRASQTASPSSISNSPIRMPGSGITLSGIPVARDDPPAYDDDDDTD